jgi:DNA-nicking Smr family endonuclease
LNEHMPITREPRLRRLSAEEIELWLDVTRNVVRRPGIRLPERQQAASGEGASSSATAGHPLVEAKPKGASAPAGGELPPAPAPLDRRLRQKLARGRSVPDAALDLHGLRAQEAYVALRRFLNRAQADGARLVLVVTGKGERPGFSEGSGVLRKSVPHWLRSPDYHAIVAGFEEAARPHGGTGALYVKLRRRDRALR